MGQNSENVLPTLRDFFNAEKTVVHSRRTCRDDFVEEIEGFSEIPFYQVLNSSFKNIPPRPTKSANIAKDKKGLLYQSSENFSTEHYSSGGSVGVWLKSNGKQKRLTKPLGSERRNMEPRLQKSYSARVGIPFVSSSTEKNISSSIASSTSWFSRIKKISNPFANLHSQRNRFMHSTGNINVNVKEMVLTNNTSRKPSPVHLHAHLSLEYELGMPVFKFSLDCLHDVYIANTSRSDIDSRIVYLFHYIGGRRNRNVNEQRVKVSGVESSIIGQMQVSTRICLESKPEEDNLKPAVMEFVLCDTAHAQRSEPKQEKLTRENSFRRGWATFQSKCSENRGLDHSNDPNPNPWPASDLHPGLEIAAIVIRDPSSSDESFGYMKNSDFDRREVKVIVPTGNHGLPNTENSCPLPILQRWRSGGGCDCSGWDMGCHLFVLESSNTDPAKDPKPINNHHFLELFIEGMKEERTPAMTMTLLEEGEYEVDFHAKLSALQAFSICVAMLHRTEVSTRDTSTTFSRCSSLRELIDMEPQDDLDIEITREVPPSFMPNVTFSPISRV